MKLPDPKKMLMVECAWFFFCICSSKIYITVALVVLQVYDNDLFPMKYLICTIGTISCSFSIQVFICVSSFSAD